MKLPRIPHNRIELQKFETIQYVAFVAWLIVAVHAALGGWALHARDHHVFESFVWLLTFLTGRQSYVSARLYLRANSRLQGISG